MSIRFLRTFVTVAREGSFAAAAESLGLTQSAVSLQMKSLEEELRTELFDRTARRPTLNARGRALLERAEELVRLYDGLSEAVSDEGDLAGMLVFGAVNTVATGVLPRALSLLKATHERLQTRVVSGLSAELVHQVDCGKIDAAIVSAPPSELDHDLVWHPLFDEPLVVIAPLRGSRDHGEAPAEADPCHDAGQLLESFPYIRFNRRAWAGRLIHGALRNRGIRVSESMELDSLEAIALMVSEGLGVSLVPLRRIAEPFPAPVKVVPFGDPPPCRTVGMVTRAGSARTALSDALAKALAESADNARDNACNSSSAHEKD